MKCGDWRANGRRVCWMVLLLGLCGLGACVPAKPGEPSADTQLTDTVLDVPLGTDTAIFDLTLPETVLECPGSPGCACAVDPDCNTGLCLETAVGRLCATLCVDSCPAGFACRSTPVAGDPLSYCAPVGVQQCAPCQTKADCNAAWSFPAECIDAGLAGSFCASTCSLSSDCPDTYQCVDVAGQGKVCQPQGGMQACTCSAWAKASGNTTTCDVLEGTLACPGTRTCDAAGLTACTKLAGEPCADAGCKDAKDGSACDDGDPCTQSECQAGVCSATTNFCKCQQSSDCTDDGDLCNGVPFCDKSAIPYSCKVNPATVVSCPAPSGPCKSQVCNPASGTCSENNVQDGNTCNDSDPCFANKTCSGGQCQGGIQTCACTKTSDCTALDNNDLCDGSLYCDLVSHSCKINPATVVQCPASGKPCEVTSCLPATGQCDTAAKPEAAPCEDGAACTVGDFCQGGQCVAGTVTCNCQKDADCATYEDGDACNGVLFCNKATAKCQINPKTIVQCQSGDNTECQQNLCDPLSGACAMAFAPTPTLCEDGNPCSASDHCDGSGGCISSVDICPCDNDGDCASSEDGNLCNGTLYCELTTKTCQLNPATVVTCPWSGDNPCAPIECQPLTGQCEASPLLAGGCDDGDPCTAKGSCVAGVCKAGPNLCQCKTSADCLPFDDANLCNGKLFCDVTSGQCKPNPASIVTCPPTTDACSQNSCDPATGKCTVTAGKDGSWCDDGETCTKSDDCQDGACQPGTLVCDCLTTADCADGEDGNLCNGTLFCDKSGPEPACVLNPASVVKCADTGAACTDPVCLPDTGTCTQQPVTGDCSDNNACTTGDVCQAGICIAGSAVTCNDDNPCTDDSCNPASGCVFAPTTAPCDDDNACTQTDTCNQGDCVGANPVDCPDPQLCHDMGSCDTATGQCIEPVRPDNSGCDDGDACTQSDTCQSGSCVGASPVVCTALDQCHDVGVCDSQTGACSNPAKPNDSACDDGDACTSTDRCQGGSCDGSDPIDCPLPGQCQEAGICDPGTGTCNYNNKSPFTPCNDGNACTKSDVCSGGNCVGNLPVVCTALDQCHDIGTCNTTTGVCDNPTKADNSSCSDGDACTSTDRCQGGSCEGSDPVDCPLPDQCHEPGICDSATGTCTYQDKELVICDDGNACTKTDLCFAGECVGNGQVACKALDQCHDIGVCDSQTGVCDNPAKVDTSSCNDGDLCTQTDTCQGGICMGANPVTCSELDQCHDAGTCDPQTGACSNPNKPDDEPCQDSNPCTDFDTCQAGSCTGGSPATCTALDQCHDVGVCDPDTGICSDPAKTNGSTCTDNNACTQVDTCQAGSCVGNVPVTCNEQDKCHDAGICDTGTGTCSNPEKADGTTCQDGNACTEQENCQQGSCQNGVPVVCNDNNPCTNDSCDTGTGCAYTANTVPCDDGSACTEQDTCTDGSCVGATVACDDNNRYTNDSCDPAIGCKYLAREICNGADDDGDGTSDNVLCGGLSCTCDDGVTRCQPGCTACPDPDDFPIAIDDGGTSRVICAHAWPHWGTAPDSPNTFVSHGDGTVSDGLTGLQWQQVVDPGSYTWTLAAPYCDALVLGGKTDWRLPTLAELHSLTDLNKALAPVVDVVKFPSTPDNLFWAAESFRGQGVKGWTVTTSTGAANSYTIATTNWGSVRCVRSASSQPRPSQRWKIVSDNAVTIDLRTGLQWQRQPSATGGPNLNGQYSQSGAGVACYNLELGGHDDWRLPSLRELQSIVDVQKTASPAWDSYAFPGTYAGIWGYFWTSTTFQVGPTFTWVVEFASGATSNRLPGDQYDIRCVRNPVCGDGTCDSGEDMRCALDCGCTTALTGQACNDGNACTTGETCAGGVCTGTSTIVCDDGWVGSSDSCDPQAGCRYSWPEVCNGQDDNYNGTTDDVFCGSATCTCDGGVTLCESTCTSCPDPGDLAIPIATSAGNKVVCAHDYPAWGLQSDSFNSYVVHGDGTATDSMTGLMWQQQTQPAASDWAAAVTACDTSTVAGYSDWRLPTMAEALSLLTYNQLAIPFVNTSVFPDTQANKYWTMTRNPVQTTSGLVVSAADGLATSQLFTVATSYARCVRSATSPAAKAQRWTKSPSAQSVVDDLTGVRWQAAPPLTGGDGTGKYSFDAAVVVCNDLVLDGYSDWRLPGLREMTSILRHRKVASPMVDSEVFPSWPSSGGQQYWTTTPYDNTITSMLAVNTNPGVILQITKTTGSIRPICVRAPQCGDGVCEDAETASCFADCGCTAQLEGKACSDVDLCTVGETCKSGACGDGSVVNCDDNNPCTTESCIPAVGCIHTPNTNGCDDSNLCTLSDTCNAGSCVGTVKDCSDEWSDNTDTCTIETGACLHVWPEVCNGVDDNFNGETDDVTCDGGGVACSCVNGVMECPSDCSVCLGALTQVIDDAGASKVICTADHPTWGILPLTPNAYTDNSDGTVSDLATGLQWQKTQDANSYTWPNAKSYCDGITLGGKMDWRLPTFAELESLLDYNKGTAPAIHNTFFPGAASAETWSATLILSNFTALFINFSDGSSGADTLTSIGRRVRCVRSQNGIPFSARRWQRPNADVVHDLRTGLTWQHEPPSTGGDGSGKYSFSGAATYCANLSLGGFDNWRAPTIRELTSVRDYRRSAAPWVDPEVLAMPGSGFGFDYWSSTTYRGGATNSWRVNFEEIVTIGNSTVASLFRPLCVRDTTCGDGICTQGETTASCTADCP